MDWADEHVPTWNARGMGEEQRRLRIKLARRFWLTGEDHTRPWDDKACLRARSPWGYPWGVITENDALALVGLMSQLGYQPAQVELEDHMQDSNAARLAPDTN